MGHVAVSPQESSAERGPLSAAELLAKSDLAGRARVVAVRLHRGGPNRVTVLWFREFTKRPVPGQLGFWRRLFGVVPVILPPAGTPSEEQARHGRWSGGYRPGDTVMTHLRFNPQTRTFHTVAWNAVWLTPSR